MNQVQHEELQWYGMNLSKRAENRFLINVRTEIGLVNCRIRWKVKVTKCYRCFGFSPSPGGLQGTEQSKVSASYTGRRTRNSEKIFTRLLSMDSKS
ncbi:hypothetical protein J6590_032565 [Homalodisca vitripennis]|nr:hypothetical protein J6590_032565 [Homalodisca vitripennis]